MNEKVLDKIIQDESNYNLIVSNIILSQTDKFTYNDIMDKLESVCGENKKIKKVVKKCLIRMRDDGNLTVLGPTYSVVDLDM